MTGIFAVIGLLWRVWHYRSRSMSAHDIQQNMSGRWIRREQSQALSHKCDFYGFVFIRPMRPTNQSMFCGVSSTIQSVGCLAMVQLVSVFQIFGSVLWHYSSRPSPNTVWSRVKCSIAKIKVNHSDAELGLSSVFIAGLAVSFAYEEATSAQSWVAVHATCRLDKSFLMCLVFLVTLLQLNRLAATVMSTLFLVLSLFYSVSCQCCNAFRVRFKSLLLKTV